MNNKKIIFFDIDGTLLNEKKVIPSTTIEALTRLKQAGHQIFVCTGRTKCMLPKEIIDLDFDGYVYGGGTALEYEGQLLHFVEISYDQIVSLTQLLKRYNISYAYEGHDYVYLEKQSFHDERPYYRSFICALGEVCISFDGYDEIKASKVTCILPKEMTKEDRASFKETLQRDYHMIFHEQEDNGIMTDGLLEILPKGCTKGTGIELMADKLGIDLKNTVGVGDSNNDLEMLEVVETAICMGNGTSKAKALADFITKGINEDGIMHAMKTLEYIS